MVATRRCFVLPEELEPTRIRILGDEAQRLCRVLRLNPGDTIRLCDGRGREAEGQLIRVGRDQVEVDRGEIAAATAPPRTVRLVMCRIKHVRMDWLIEKAVELGATELLPAISEHTVLRDDSPGDTGRHSRLERIVREAARQCGLRHLPRVDTARPFRERLTEHPGDLRLMATCGTDAPALLEVAALRTAPPPPVTLMIGPEGGFSREESAAARDDGVHRVNLGPRILRTETASLYGLSLIRALGGD